MAPERIQPPIPSVIVVYQNTENSFRPYEPGQELTQVISCYRDPDITAEESADWAFRVFNADLDHLEVSRSQPGGEADFLYACTYRTLGLRSMSVGDVVSINTGGRSTWLACDPAGWRHIEEPANRVGSAFTSRTVYEHAAAGLSHQLASGQTSTDGTTRPAAEVTRTDPEANAWRIVTNALEVGLRHRLLALVTGEVLPLETAEEVLQACGLHSLGLDCEKPMGSSAEPDHHADAGLEPPALGAGSVAAIGTTREWERARYLRHAAQIRKALLAALYHGGIDSRPGAHGPYAMIDDLLRGLGLPALPRAHLYEITATIPTIVNAPSPAEARIAAWRLLRDASATTPQYGMPVIVAETFREPVITAADTGSYRVVWYETYLVCLRGSIPARRLAEAAVRIQLSLLTDEVPGITDAPLRTDYVGEHADHCLDPYRD